MCVCVGMFLRAYVDDDDDDDGDAVCACVLGTSTQLVADL